MSRASFERRYFFLDSGLWKKLAILWSAQLIGMSAITGVISFLPLYVTHLGINDVEEASMWSGLLVGAAAFCAALSNPFWGAMADRRGRKTMLEKVLLIFAFLMIAMAFVRNVYQLLALRLLQGTFGGFTAAATALAVSLSPKDKIASTIGIFQTSLIVGGAVGPMIGGLIADYFGYRQPFLVFGFLCILSFLIIHFTITENFSPLPKNEKPSIKAVFKYFLSMTDLKIMLFILFLATFAIQGLGPILPLYIRSIASDQSNIATISGTLIAVGGIASAFSSASMGALVRHYSHKQIMVVASVLGGITFIGQIIADDIMVLSVMRFFNGLCIGAMVPSANTIITYLIPESKRGAAFGATSTFSLMGQVLGPISAGFLSLIFGIKAIFWVTTALFLLAAILLLTKIKDRYEVCCEEGN